MGYCFERDKSVQKGLRQIAAAQVDSAIGEIDDHALDAGTVVHQVRKRCKKLRGLIRLVRPCFDNYADENAAIRDAATPLSPLRDAAVMIKTCDALIEAYGAEINRAVFAGVRRRLIARRKKIARAQDEADRKLGDFRDAMVAARARIDGWTLAESGFDAVAGGLAKTYKRARKAMKQAERTPEPETLHLWRKHIKYHGYHARLLTPVWSSAMTAHREAADRLGDLLGNHHDLAVFEQTVTDAAEGLSASTNLQAMIGLIHRRQATLAAEAFTLGARLLAEPPDLLVKRWHSYWTQWRDQDAAAA